MDTEILQTTTFWIVCALYAFFGLGLDTFVRHIALLTRSTGDKEPC